MSKKPKKPGAKKETVKPSEVMKMIAEKDFTTLLRRCASLKKQNQSVSGEMGQLIGNAVENKNLDRKAFGIIRNLLAMPEQKMATTLACFDYYRDISKLDEIAGRQGDLGIARQEAGEGDETETGSQVSRPRLVSSAEPEQVAG